jgi:hypothetical protein
MKKVNVTIVIILAVITLGSVCGADDNVINGCYQKKNGQLRIIVKPADCNASEFPISWNVREPGYVVTEFIRSPEGSTNSTGYAYCNEGDYVTGCSYSLVEYAPSLSSLSDYSFPIVAPAGCSLDEQGLKVCTACRVLMHRTVSLGEPAFHVYAYCGRSNH